MTTTRLLRVLLLCPLFMLIVQASWAQTKTVTGKVSDEKGAPIAGASVLVKGTNTGTSTDASGAFKISAPASATALVITYVGYTSQEVNIPSSNDVSITLQPASSTLTDVVVIGYGTARKKDLTGSVASVQAKDFNKGIVTSADQLIQGKVPGVQVVNNSGAPGGAATVRIRGSASVRSGNQPLFVVDGVPLDGRTPRPGFGFQLGNTPNANPLNFINPNDIASIDILKDASATAIYGSRGANGVVIITTKKGQSGATKLDVSATAGISNILKTYDVLNANEYRAALESYDFPIDTTTGRLKGDYGSSVDAMDAITRTALTQNYNVGMSGGNETGRYRLSLGYIDQEGIVKNSGFKRYTANLSGAYKFLESKKLGIDFNLVASQNHEDIAPVTNDAGFEGSLIGNALQWNPTHPLYNPDGSIWIKDPNLGSQTVNPIALLAAYKDVSKITDILASISPSFKFTKELEYRMLYSVNYGSGIRRSSILSWMNFANTEGRGIASSASNELLTQQITHTLSYNTQVTSRFNLNAVVGYEYQRFENKGFGLSGQDFQTNAIDYNNIFSNTSQSSRGIYGFEDPISELQSYFGRATFNYEDKYLLTATFRADGSSKFGSNNKYGYFPSFAAAWNITNEDFLKNNIFANNLKLRLGWGKTGNQEFPAGAAQERYALGISGPGTLGQVNVANPDLKWETSTSYNAGLDFSIWDNRIFGSVDYFNKKTTDLLFQFDAIQPAPATKYWINLAGEVINKGWEVAIGAALIRQKDIRWNFGINASFLQNELKNYTGPTVLTGGLHGQGSTGAYSQRLESGHPLNAFYTREFLGIDKTTGLGTYTDDGNTFFFIGDPNPHTLLGISTDFTYKKLALVVNMNGAFGHQIFNNTLMSVLSIGNLGNRNIASSLVNTDVKESSKNTVTASTRFLENGDYLKMANATLSYNIGNIGKIFRNANIFLTGQNLFIITNFSGFDPEVNVDKNINGVPSFGIEYIPYPTARSFLLGVNFSL